VIYIFNSSGGEKRISPNPLITTSHKSIGIAFSFFKKDNRVTKQQNKIERKKKLENFNLL